MRERVLRGTPTHILRALLSTTRVGTLKNNSQAYRCRASALAGARPGGAKHITPVLLLFLAATAGDCAIAELVIHTAPAAHHRTV